jgi:hypothetical protein
MENTGHYMSTQNNAFIHIKVLKQRQESLVSLLPTDQRRILRMIKKLIQEEKADWTEDLSGTWWLISPGMLANAAPGSSINSSLMVSWLIDALKQKGFLETKENWNKCF